MLNLEEATQQRRRQSGLPRTIRTSHNDNSWLHLSNHALGHHSRDIYRVVFKSLIFDIVTAV